MAVKSLEALIASFQIYLTKEFSFTESDFDQKKAGELVKMLNKYCINTT